MERRNDGEVSNEVDGAPLVLGLRQSTAVGAHNHVALNMQMVSVGVPRLHLEPDGRAELEPQRDPPPSHVPRQLSRQGAPGGDSRPRYLPRDRRRVLRRLVERKHHLSGAHQPIPVVDRADHGVVVDADLLVRVPVRDVE